MLCNVYGAPVYQAADRDINTMKVNNYKWEIHRCYYVA